MKQSHLGLELALHFKMRIILFILILFFNNTFVYSDNKIAYIDINYIINNSNVGKLLNNHINEYKNKHFEKLKETEKKLKKKENELISKKNIIDKNEFNNKLKILKGEINNYNLERNKINEKINNIKIKGTKKILVHLDPLIKNHVENNSISIVLPKKNIIVGKKNLDITDIIINDLNNNVKTIDF